MRARALVSAWVPLTLLILPLFGAENGKPLARSDIGEGARAASPAGARFEPHSEGTAGGSFVVRKTNGVATCSTATVAEALAISKRPDVPLYRLREKVSSLRPHATGLVIELMGTAQLNGYPEAKAAFERAAAIWENRIADPITIYVAVDYGSTRFGEPFDGEIGSTMSPAFGGHDGSYTQMRAALNGHAHNATEAGLYSALPSTSLPTDLGPTTRTTAGSPVLRALGLLAAAASPDDTNLPTIGFNSAFSFDFDPSNGIASNKTDFEAVAVHEMGHLLGFESSVGALEMGLYTANVPTVWDLFRFRPGVTSATFANANRVQSSGGEQVAFGGLASLALSTGRPDGTGGDLQQASHWKADDLTSIRIGLMDPTIGDGERGELTPADVNAFAIMGYNVVAASASCTESEPNEHTGNADSTTLPATCSGSAGSTDAYAYTINYTSAAPGKIQDVFAVTLLASAKLDVTLTFTNNTADLDVALFTVSGSQINFLESSTGSTTTERFLTDTLSPGLYYIGVSAYSGSSPYLLSAFTVAGTTACTPNSTTACLLSNRFKATVRFRGAFDNNPADSNALVKTVTGFSNANYETTFFYFNSPDNIEILLKMLDQGNTNSSGQPTIAVLFGSATPLRVELMITDTKTGAVRQYTSAFAGQAGTTDFTAFVK